MTGLKSGSGDDLWSDDGDESEAEGDEAGGTETEEADEARAETEATAAEESTETVEADDAEIETAETDEAEGDGTGEDETEGDETEEDEVGETEESADSTPTRPYIVRRAVRDKSVQFERDERLTFFVHEDVADGERALVTEVESALGRDVPKFDVREAVYRAALRNPDDVLDALLEMGYSLDEE